MSKALKAVIIFALIIVSIVLSILFRQVSFAPYLIGSIAAFISIVVLRYKKSSLEE